MKFTLIIIFTLFFSVLTYSQSTIINGKVVDSDTQSALQYVNIYVKGTTIWTVSNIAGDFSLSIQKNTLMILWYLVL